mgnify:CR=1 FL=1
MKVNCSLSDQHRLHVCIRAQFVLDRSSHPWSPRHEEVYRIKLGRLLLEGMLDLPATLGRLRDVILAKVITYEFVKEMVGAL